jgi:hypothetical protein
MGLDAFIRKLPKDIVVQADQQGEYLKEIRGFYWPKNELLYWRNHRKLNMWMLTRALDRYHITPSEVLSGREIRLDEEDLLALKLEMMFGDMFKTYWGGGAQRLVDIDARIIDHIIRVVRRGKSIVFYTSSW